MSNKALVWLRDDFRINNNDAFSFFEKTKDLIYTGPTLTNVNDFRAVLVLPN